MNRLLGEYQIAQDSAAGRGALEQALEWRRWQEADLAKRAKGDLGKVKISGRLREETLVTVKWIAERLGWGRRVM